MEKLSVLQLSVLPGLEQVSGSQAAKAGRYLTTCSVPG